MSDVSSLRNIAQAVNHARSNSRKDENPEVIELEELQYIRRITAAQFNDILNYADVSEINKEQLSLLYEFKNMVETMPLDSLPVGFDVFNPDRNNQIDPPLLRASWVNIFDQYFYICAEIDKYESLQDSNYIRPSNAYENLDSRSLGNTILTQNHEIRANIADRYSRFLAGTKEALNAQLNTLEFIQNVLERTDELREVNELNDYLQTLKSISFDGASLGLVNAAILYKSNGLENFFGGTNHKNVPKNLHITVLSTKTQEIAGIIQSKITSAAENIDPAPESRSRQINQASQTLQDRQETVARLLLNAARLNEAENLYNAYFSNNPLAFIGDTTIIARLKTLAENEIAAGDEAAKNDDRLGAYIHYQNAESWLNVGDPQGIAKYLDLDYVEKNIGFLPIGEDKGAYDKGIWTATLNKIKERLTNDLDQLRQKISGPEGRLVELRAKIDVIDRKLTTENILIASQLAIIAEEKDYMELYYQLKKDVRSLWQNDILARITTVPELLDVVENEEFRLQSAKHLNVLPSVYAEKSLLLTRNPQTYEHNQVEIRRLYNILRNEYDRPGNKNRWLPKTEDREHPVYKMLATLNSLTLVAIPGNSREEKVETEVIKQGQSASAPIVLPSGGETTSRYNVPLKDLYDASASIYKVTDQDGYAAAQQAHENLVIASSTAESYKDQKEANKNQAETAKDSAQGSQDTAHDNLSDAQDRVNDANDILNNAKIAVTDAQSALADAENDYGTGSQEAIDAATALTAAQSEQNTAQNAADHAQSDQEAAQIIYDTEAAAYTAAQTVYNDASNEYAAAKAAYDAAKAALDASSLDLRDYCSPIASLGGENLGELFLFDSYGQKVGLANILSGAQVKDTSGKVIGFLYNGAFWQIQPDGSLVDTSGSSTYELITNADGTVTIIFKGDENKLSPNGPEIGYINDTNIMTTALKVSGIDQINGVLYLVNANDAFIGVPELNVDGTPKLDKDGNPLITKVKDLKDLLTLTGTDAATGAESYSLTLTMDDIVLLVENGAAVYLSSGNSSKTLGLKDIVGEDHVYAPQELYKYEASTTSGQALLFQDIAPLATVSSSDPDKAIGKIDWKGETREFRPKVDYAAAGVQVNPNTGTFYGAGTVEIPVTYYDTNLGRITEIHTLHFPDYPPIFDVVGNSAPDGLEIDFVAARPSVSTRDLFEYGKDSIFERYQRQGFDGIRLGVGKYLRFDNPYVQAAYQEIQDANAAQELSVGYEDLTALLALVDLQKKYKNGVPTDVKNRAALLKYLNKKYKLTLQDSDLTSLYDLALLAAPRITLDDKDAFLYTSAAKRGIALSAEAGVNSSSFGEGDLGSLKTFAKLKFSWNSALGALNMDVEYALDSITGLPEGEKWEDNSASIVKSKLEYVFNIAEDFKVYFGANGEARIPHKADEWTAFYLNFYAGIFGKTVLGKQNSDSPTNNKGVIADYSFLFSNQLTALSGGGGIQADAFSAYFNGGFTLGYFRIGAEGTVLFSNHGLLSDGSPFRNIDPQAVIPQLRPNFSFTLPGVPLGWGTLGLTAEVSADLARGNTRQELDFTLKTPKNYLWDLDLYVTETFAKPFYKGLQATRLAGGAGASVTLPGSGLNIGLNFDMRQNSNPDGKPMLVDVGLGVKIPIDFKKQQ
jgi:hypothetical protein